MCRSMTDIQSTAAEIGEEKKKKIERRKKLQGNNIMAPLLHRAAIIRVGLFGGLKNKSLLATGPRTDPMDISQRSS